MTAVDVVDFESVAPRVEQILRKLLGDNATIDLRKGFEGRVKIKVISPLFNGMEEAEKGSVVWNVLNAEMKEDIANISYVVAYSTDEL